MHRPTEARRALPVSPRRVLRRCAGYAALIVLVAVSLAACGDRGPLTDGAYTVAYDAADADGRRPFLQVHVRRGFIRSVCYDSIDAGGVLGSADERYRHRVVQQGGADPADVVQELEEALLAERLESGDSHVEIPAAIERLSPRRVARFRQLVDAFFARAQSQSEAVEPDEAILIPLDEVYQVEDAPDEMGWIARLQIEFRDGEVVLAEVAEYRHGPHGVEWKRQDEAYAQAFAEATSLTPELVYDEIVAMLVGASDLSFDAISGATGTSNRFSALLDRITALRRPPPIPPRACRR